MRLGGGVRRNPKSVAPVHEETFRKICDGDLRAGIDLAHELDLERARGGIHADVRDAPLPERARDRGRGAGEAILRHLIAEAERRGYAWLGLETGRPDAFIPARALYAKYGFSECQDFGDYVSDEFSLCMSRTLTPA